MAYKFNPFTGNFDAVNDPIKTVPVTTATFLASANTIVLSRYNSGIRQIELPDATTVKNAQITVKDALGNSETANRHIFIFCNAGAIDGDYSVEIRSNYGALTFVSDGTDWYTI